MLRSVRSLSTSIAVAGVLIGAECVAAAPMPGDPPPGDSAVDQMTGSAQMGVGIDVPPGTGGFAPQLMLNYASQGGDSPYGTGFSLVLGPVPLGEVRVSTRFLPNGSSVVYELDGEKLVPNGTRYHTGTAESFKRITREGSGSTAGWLVELPNGSKARYGQDASTRFPSAAPTRWLLSAVTDKSGNTIRVTYADASVGTPSVIAYSYQGSGLTAPAIGGLREVRFVYESRPDPLYDFMGYEFRRITTRLREIRVLSGGNVFRRYSVLYTSNGAGQGRSLVSSIQRFGTDCSNLSQAPEQLGCIGLPAQRMTYTANVLPQSPGSQTGSDDATGVPVSNFFTESPNGPLIDAGVRQGDVNGDGLIDLVQAYRAPSGGVNQSVFLNTGDGWSADTNNSWTTSLRAITFQDKKLRIVTGPPCQSDTLLASGASVLDAGPEKVIFSDRRPTVGPYTNGYRDTTYAQSWQLVDLNADGFSDLITSYDIGFNGCPAPGTPPTKITEVWLNNRQGGWTRSAVSNDSTSYRSLGAIYPLNSGAPNRYDYHPIFGDFDGDGLADLAVLHAYNTPDAFGGICPGTLTELVIERSPFSGFAGAARILDVPRSPGGTPQVHYRYRQEYDCVFASFRIFDGEVGAAFVDINRDGIEDFIKTSVSNYTNVNCNEGSSGVWLGRRGGGFCSSQEGCPEAIRYLPPVPLADNAFCDAGATYLSADTGVRIIDANGDGWLDIVQGRQEVRSSGTTSVRHGYIHDPSASGTSVWRTDDRFAPAFDLAKINLATSPGVPPIQTPMTLRYVDIDADGAEDVLYAGGKKMSRTTLPDLIASFDNGGGGVIGFAHETTVRQRTTGNFNELVNLALTVQGFEALLPGELGLPAEPPYSTRRWTKTPVVVVQTVKNMAEVGAPDAVMEFSYDAPGYSMENRSSLGFGGVLMKRPDGSFSRMIFAQQKGVAGRLVSMVTLQSDLAPVSELREVYQVRDGSFVPGSVADVPVPRQVGSKSRVIYPNDPLPLGQYTQETTIAYDDTYGYNFVSSVTELHNTGKLTVSSTPTAASGFITPTLYVPGLPSHVEQRDSANRLLSSNDLSYDALGRLTRTTSLIQPRDNPSTSSNRVMETTYDLYGNVRSTSTGAVAGTPLVTQFMCYDGDTALGAGLCPNPAGSLDSHSLLVGMLDALGKLTTMVPNPTTGLTGRMVAFNGDVTEMVFDSFGRVIERAVDPVRGSIARTVLERRVYNDVYFPGLFRPYVEVYKKTGNGSEEIRSAMLPDGFGNVDRTTVQTPSGYAGKVVRRDPLMRTVRESFSQVCTDAYCRDIPATVYPATVTSRDLIGRVVKVEEWGDAQTMNTITLAQFERGVRSQPTSFTPPGASTYFESVLSKDPKGNLKRGLFDADRLVWSEECANTVTPMTNSLTGVSCSSPDTSYFVYDATGEQVRLYDPSAYPSGPFSDPNHYVGTSFDTLARPVSSSDPDGGTTLSLYNVLGQKTQIINARSQSTTLTYDLLGRVKTINRPGSEPDSTLTYSDELSTQGNRVLARVVNASAGVSPTQEDFQYDPFDNPSYRKTSFTVSGASTSLVTRFQSDLLGRQTRIDYPDMNTSVGYTYVGNALNRVCELNSSGACVIDYLSSIQYDALGRESKAFGPSYVPTPSLTPYRLTTYDARTYRVAHQELATVQSLQGSADARLNFDYQYDELGNVTAIDDLNPTSDSSLAPFSDASYTYDSRNRLKSRTLGGITKYYSYDRLGNLTGNLLATATGTANQTYNDAQRPHAIQSAGSTTFAYDADANMTRRGTQFLGYNAENKLICSGSSATSCTTVQIGYDSAGLRASEVASAGPSFYAGDLFEYQRTSKVGTAHIFALGREIAFKKIPTVTLRTAAPLDGGSYEDLPQLLVVALFTVTGCVIIVLLLNSGAGGAWLRRPAFASALFLLAGLVAFPPNTWASAFPPAPTGVYRRWLSSDLTQSGIYVHDEQGRRAHKRVFEPFGSIFAEVNSESTPREFAMHLYDSSLSLYYMKARFYDPSVGRFTSLDPLIRDSETVESVNPYSYVENNPVNRLDPTGREGTVFNFGSSAAPYGYSYGAGQVNVIGSPGASVYGAFSIEGTTVTPLAGVSVGVGKAGASTGTASSGAASSGTTSSSTASSGATSSKSSGSGFFGTLADFAKLPLGLAIGLLAVPFNIVGGLVPEIGGFDIGIVGDALTKFSLSLTPGLSNAAIVFALNATLGLLQGAVGLGYLGLNGLAYLATLGPLTGALPDIDFGFDRGGITISGGLQSVFTKAGFETAVTFGLLRFFSTTSAVGTLGSHESGHSVRSALQGPLYLPLILSSYFEAASAAINPIEPDATSAGLP